jgi:hypothetical protein
MLIVAGFVLVFVAQLAIRLTIKVSVAFFATADASKVTAIVISLLALWVSWSNYRRGNTAILKIVRLETSGCSAIDVNNRQPYSVFTVVIKNVGIPLKNPLVVLSGFTRAGTVHIPLRQMYDDKPIEAGGSLEKGMFGIFALRSFELHPGQRAMIAALADREVEDASIKIASNGFAVASFRLRDRAPIRALKKRWNDWSFGINQRFFWKNRVRWGRTFLHTRNILPKLQDQLAELQMFAQGLAQERQPPPIQ